MRWSCSSKGTGRIIRRPARSPRLRADGGPVLVGQSQPAAGARGLSDRRYGFRYLGGPLQRGRRRHRHLRGALAAQHAVRLSRAHARRRRRRLAADLRGPRSPSTNGSRRTSACRDWQATRRFRRARVRRCRLRPSARWAGAWRAHTTNSAGTGGRRRMPSPRAPTARSSRVTQRATCMWGCVEGAKGSVDITHWPQLVKRGAQLVTGARVRRLETNADGLVTGAEYVDRNGHDAFPEGGRHHARRPTASARRGCCCSRLRRGFRTASAIPRAWSAGG